MTTAARPKRTPPRAIKKPPAAPDVPTLYTHAEHRHNPQNANVQHQEEVQAGGLNAKIAVAITRALGSMPCAYIFMALAISGFPGLHAAPPQYVQWVSQTCIQLVALSVLQVGANIIGRKMELLVEEIFKFIVKTYHDAEQMKKHMDAQDAELLTQSKMIRLLLTKNGITPEQ